MAPKQHSTGDTHDNERLAIVLVFHHSRVEVAPIYVDSQATVQYLKGKICDTLLYDWWFWHDKYLTLDFDDAPLEDARTLASYGMVYGAPTVCLHKVGGAPNPDTDASGDDEGMEEDSIEEDSLDESSEEEEDWNIGASES